MKTPPSFNFNVGSFIQGTGHFTAEEVGAYVLLLCHQWDHGSIPDDAIRQANIARCKVSGVVAGKFHKGEDGLIRNRRLEKDRPTPCVTHSEEAGAFPATIEAARQFNRKIGCPDEFSDKVWNIAMARGQCDKNGLPIVSWEHFLAAAFTFDKENARGTTKHRGNSRPSDDRNRGTLNEGQAAQYRGVGQVD